MWNDNYGGHTRVTAELWGSNAIEVFDNGDNWVIVKTPDNATYNPGTYSKLVWTEINQDSFWYCTIAYSLGSMTEASVWLVDQVSFLLIDHNG